MPNKVKPHYYLVGVGSEWARLLRGTLAQERGTRRVSFVALTTESTFRLGLSKDQFFFIFYF